jgi:hypothetical protein
LIAVRWDELFADLEAQADALDRAERSGEVAERTRIELASIGMLDRLRPAQGGAVRLQLRGGAFVAGTLERVGVDWLLVSEGAAREMLVVLSAVQAVSGLGRAAAVPNSGGAVAARLTLRSALRGLARDRSGVALQLVDGTVLAATIDRVGNDFVEAARHAPGELRRQSAVRDVVLLPFAAIAAVRRER